MNSLVIARHDHLLCAVATGDGGPTDIYAETSDRPDLTGAILRGKVTRLLPSQHAAIIGWGKGNEGYWTGTPPGLNAGDRVLLQVKSGAWQDKLPQLVADIALPGRYLVHLPFGKAVTASRRGTAVALPENLPGGWILRRHAAKATPEILQNEIDYLLRAAKALDAPEADGILSTQPAWRRAILDHGAGLDAIICADSALLKPVADWLRDFAPDLHGLCRGGDHGIDLDGLFDGLAMTSVDLQGGPRLTIERTRGFWAADVDSGAMPNHLQANILAARELARQMRLRNIGGMVVADFISLRGAAAKQNLLDALRAATADDPAGVNVFGMTKLGLIELTRQRRGPALDEIVNR